MDDQAPAGYVHNYDAAFMRRLDRLHRPKADSIRADVLATLRQHAAGGHAPTIAELAAAVGHPYASSTVSAKLRELRLERYGAHKITCERCRDEERGDAKIYRYRLVF